MKRLFTMLTLVSALALIPACGGSEEGHDHGDAAGAFDEITTAICVLRPTEGNTASGSLTFTQTKDGVRVQGTISGLTPNSKHGFHIHQFADVSAANGTATGGHYNPADIDHSLPVTETHDDHEHTSTGGHAGDLGNLEANDQGVAEYDVTFSNLTIAGSNAILGRSIIVHAGEDDGQTQPTGNAGPRIAQGVIGIANAAVDGE